MANSRSAIAKVLLETQRRISADLLRIDGLKEQLRDLCEKDGAGFTEEVEGLGSVEVKAGAPAKLRGILPELDPEAFLALPESRRAKMIGDGLVEMAEQWSKASKPSVTVRL